MPGNEIVGTAEIASRKNRLRQIIAANSFRTDREFTLASGRKSRVFFDLKPTMMDPEGLALIGELVSVEIAEVQADAIGGLVMGAVPIVLSVVLKCHESGRRIAGFWVRKAAKDHGTESLVDGHLPAGARVVVVEDVTTTGGSVMRAIEAVRARGCEIVKLLTIIDREEGAGERLAEEGLKLDALFAKRDFTELA